MINLTLYFGYMGPVIGVFAWNAIGSLIAIICVYIFLHKDEFNWARKKSGVKPLITEN